MRTTKAPKRWDYDDYAEAHQKARQWVEPKINRNAHCDWKPTATREQSWKRSDNCFVVVTTTKRVDPRIEFSKLAEQWRLETEDYAITELRYSHEAYLRIIGLIGTVGPHATQWILDELKTDPDWWFGALKAITGAEPAQHGDDFDSAVEAWLEWGRDHGFDA